VPAATLVVPPKVLRPVINRLPLPAFVSAPAPVTGCARVEEKDCVSIVPPPAFNVTARVPARSTLWVSCSVPPLNARLPVVAPSALSVPIATVPSVKVVPPEYVLPLVAAGASVKLPGPVFSTAPLPEISPA
jgi:hypothetical protein